MNSLRYLILFAATVLVVSAQQSTLGSEKGLEVIQAIEQSSKQNEDALIFLSATRLLKLLFLNGTNDILESRATIRSAIESAKNLISGQPNATETLIRQAMEKAQKLVYQSGAPFFRSYGGALALSNYGAQQGLEMASRLVQEAGVAILNAMNEVGLLFKQGISGKAYAGVELLKAIDVGVDVGYIAALNKIKESIRLAIQALRDAQSNPQQQAAQLNCGPSINDPDGSDALREINESADRALRRGANAALVQRLSQVFICSLNDFLKIVVEGQQGIENLKQIADGKASIAEMTFFKRAIVLEGAIHNLAAKLYVTVGEVAQRSGKLFNNEIVPAIDSIERGKVLVFLGTKIAGDSIVISLRYEGQAPELGFEAALRIGDFVKETFLRAIVRSFRLTLSVL